MRRLVRLLFLSILLSLVIFITGCSSTPEADSQAGAETGAPTTEAAAEAAGESSADAASAAEAARLAADTERLMAELAEARESAVTAGADSLFPDEFAKVAAEYDALLKARQENPDQDYRSQIEGLRDTYLAMAKLTQSSEMRERIVTAGLQDTDTENFQKGEAASTKAKKMLAEGALDASLNEQATIAYDAYHVILEANYETMCQSQRNQAMAAKEKADSLKAAMAAKDEYAAAALVLTNADTAYNGKSYEVAYDGFVDATKQFTAVYEEVFVRRATAEEAIRRAKQKVGASAALAAEADEIAPLQEEGAASETADGGGE